MFPFLDMSHLGPFDENKQYGTTTMSKHNNNMKMILKITEHQVVAGPRLHYTT